MTKKQEPKISDWDYVYLVAKAMVSGLGLPSGFPGSAEKFEASMQETRSLVPFEGRFRELGLSYQKMLAALVSVMEIETVVETGVRTGVSTRYLLAAPIDELHSVDPMYVSETQARQKLEAAVPGCPLPGDDPRWHFWPHRSVDALLEIAKKLGSWDMFVHDGDHRLETMTFDLEMGWAFLRPGGLLVCDDWEFPRPNGNPHGAFETFCKRRGLSWNTIGTAAVIVKPESSDDKVTNIASPEQLFQAAVSVAVTDQRKHDPGTEPGYASYLK